MTKLQKIIWSVVAVVVLLSIYIVVDNKLRNATVATNNTNTPATSTQSTGVTASGSYKIEQVPVNQAPTAPDLNRQTVLYPGATVAPEAKSAALSKISTLVTMLKNNPLDASSWIDLGIYQKMAGDYEGAVLSWKYVTEIAPTSFIAFADLGDLYAYFIKDNGLAETYYKKAISVSPTQDYVYVQLSDVYRYVFKDMDKARAIIDQGLKILPNDSLLLQAKANLQ